MKKPGHYQHPWNRPSKKKPPRLVNAWSGLSPETATRMMLRCNCPTDVHYVDDSDSVVIEHHHRKGCPALKVKP